MVSTSKNNVKHRILIVDDERDVVQLAAKWLRSQGFEVNCLFSGEGLIDQVRREKPDLIFLDVWLPDISGVDLFLQLKNDPVTKATPVVFFSADPLQEKECQRIVGKVPFLKKPFEPKRLCEIIEDQLGRLAEPA